MISNKNNLEIHQNLERILLMIGKVDTMDTNDFDETDCLEMLIYLGSRRHDSRKLAEALIRAHGSLGAIFNKSGNRLRAMFDLDHLTLALLAIVKSSMKAVLAAKLPSRIKAESYAAIVEYLSLDLRFAEKENLKILYLDRKCHLITEEVARGTIDQVAAYPREIIESALLYRAASVVLAHNHCSDDPSPSTNDLITTCNIRDGLHLLDINLLDHIIFAGNNTFSMKGAGYI